MYSCAGCSLHKALGWDCSGGSSRSGALLIRLWVLVWGWICLKWGAHFSNLNKGTWRDFNCSLKTLLRAGPCHTLCSRLLLFFWGTQCIYPLLGTAAMSNAVGKCMGFWSQAARIQSLTLPLAIWVTLGNLFNPPSLTFLIVQTGIIICVPATQWDPIVVSYCLFLHQ